MLIDMSLLSNFRWMPETPQYLLSKNRRRDAEKSLRWLRGPNADLSAELEDMQKDVRKYILSNNTKLLLS